MTMGCSCLILLNIPLAKFIYAKDFFEAWKCSSVLLVSVMFNTLSVFQGSIFSAVKKTKTIAITTIISAMVNTVLNILFIPIIGVIGAAISTAFAYFVMWFVRYIYLKKYISMKINLLKDICIYMIIVVQIIFEHLKEHYYLGQIICFLLIVYINRQYIKSIIDVFRKKFGYEKR